MTEKKLSQIGNNVRKDRLVNTVTANFYTFMAQLTEMSQGKKKQGKLIIKCTIYFIADVPT